MLLFSRSQVFALNFTVFGLSDSGAGSLRQAILDSNQYPGSNTITFGSGASGVINLVSGEMLITNDVNIIGPSDQILSIGANYSSRIFHVSNANVKISGLYIATGSNTLGGGILQQGGSLTVSDCTFYKNKSSGSGGAMAQVGGNLVVTNCAIYTNSAGGFGMGISIQSNLTARVSHCTFSGNSGIGFTPAGGGIFNEGPLLIVDACTLCGNGSTGGNGGGILNNGGSVMITNCTISGNHAFVGGGVSSQAGPVAIRNTIIAGNDSITGAGGAPDCSGYFYSAGFNLIGNSTNSSGWGAVGDRIGSTASPINPLLGPLQLNGGSTMTMALLTGSPAIDKGHSSGATTDQRGSIRPYDKTSVPNAAGGDGCDIGAFETGTAILVVNNLSNTGPGTLRQAVLDAGTDDLTSIIIRFDLTGTIYLDPEIVWSKNLKIIGPGASQVGIAGPGHRAFHVTGGSTAISGVTIRDCGFVAPDGETEQDGFDGVGGAILNDITASLALSDCIVSNNFIQGGDAGPTATDVGRSGGKGLGGAIANSGTLSLTRCILTANSAIGGAGGEPGLPGDEGEGGEANGGALYSDGTFNISNCTLYANSVIGGYTYNFRGAAKGGGIFNALNGYNLISSTIASNNTVGYLRMGGGFYDANYQGVIRNCTIAGNQATGGGGYLSSGSDLGNTIIAANTPTDAQGSINSSDYNLIQYANGFNDFGATAHNIYGIDPLLGPLQDHGGAAPTMALLPGSPAIDHGTSFGFATDQRGRPRTFDFPQVANTPGGDGTDIGAFELNSALLKITPSGSGLVQITWPTNDPSFILESASTLAPSATWTNFPGHPAILNDRFAVLDIPVGARFYRLRSP